MGFYKMPTLNQIKKKPRLKKVKKSKVAALGKSPAKKGVCIKVFIKNPKKPNSANRKVARVRLSNGKFITASIPGEGHNLQEFSIVLVRGARVRDLPGVNYKLIRGKFDLLGLPNRRTSRSKYGTKRKK